MPERGKVEENLKKNLEKIRDSKMTSIEKFAAQAIAIVEEYQREAAVCELEREQRIIQHVRALKAEGYTLRQISDELASRGVFSRNGKPFEKEQVNA